MRESAKFKSERELMERYQRLIARDGMHSKLEAITEIRPEVITALKSKYSAAYVCNEVGLEDGPVIEDRRYRFRRVIHAEIYEYEEV